MGFKSLILKFYGSKKTRKIKKGANSSISPFTKIMYPENIILGKNSYINGGYVLAGLNSKIIIGNNCLISYEVHLRTTMHNYNNKNILILDQGNTEKDIIIEDDCWIGFGAQIVPGVRVKEGSVIGAGAIVTHDTEQYGVYAGIPARKIGERK